jgi:hypothetical protein
MEKTMIWKVSITTQSGNQDAIHLREVDFVIWLENSYSNSLYACLDRDFEVGDHSCITLLGFGWPKVKFGIAMMLSVVTFGLFLDESDCRVIILFSISSWDFWVLSELNSEIEGPVRGLDSRIEGHVIGYATSVGFRLLAIGHCCLIISSKIAQGL